MGCVSEPKVRAFQKGGGLFSVSLAMGSCPYLPSSCRPLQRSKEQNSCSGRRSFFGVPEILMAAIDLNV